MVRTHVGLENSEGHDGPRSVPSALSLSNYLSAILCGIVSFLSTGVGNAEDSVDKGHIDAKSFRCITEMTQVRQFYVDNLLGNLDATLAVANSATGGPYPPGTIIQLIPTETMVKRDKGHRPKKRGFFLKRGKIVSGEVWPAKISALRAFGIPRQRRSSSRWR